MNVINRLLQSRSNPLLAADTAVNFIPLPIRVASSVLGGVTP